MLFFLSAIFINSIIRNETFCSKDDGLYHEGEKSLLFSSEISYRRAS